MDSNTIIIAFGANMTSTLGSPSDAIREAFKRLCVASFRPVAMSRFYRSAAYPAGSGPDFVNACGLFRASGSPTDILYLLHEIESGLGRVRHGRWMPRVIDIDLIDCGNIIHPSDVTLRHWRDLPFEEQQKATPEQLILPHPRLEDRGFVLIPMREIVPNWVHPLTGQTLEQLVEALPESQIAGLSPLVADDLRE
ncbi:2-amino-4-hydroxy-6-hydroxymethyldihydropteridine diphosphokinase [Thioclava sp. GXIMD4215]|uniref:2-amino-4-hydroxy-6- hydroxymethyldihydropteridine diphosphokinase n=1 Tax=Thioclava sp. GXIMD4215 TaxID=3131928 RepID=UPI00324F8D40